jgi:hypothetical protein
MGPYSVALAIDGTIAAAMMIMRGIRRFIVRKAIIRIRADYGYML